MICQTPAPPAFSDEAEMEPCQSAVVRRYTEIYAAAYQRGNYRLVDELDWESMLIEVQEWRPPVDDRATQHLAQQCARLEDNINGRGKTMRIVPAIPDEGEIPSVQTSRVRGSAEVPILKLSQVEERMLRVLKRSHIAEFERQLQLGPVQPLELPEPTDIIDIFFQHRCWTGENLSIPAADLYSGYRSFCTDYNAPPSSQKCLGFWLSGRGFQSFRRGSGVHTVRCWDGITLRAA